MALFVMASERESKSRPRWSVRLAKQATTSSYLMTRNKILVIRKGHISPKSSERSWTSKPGCAAEVLMIDLKRPSQRSWKRKKKRT